jgi:pimeloyl-ACP methyl ester carboxylesterase
MEGLNVPRVAHRFVAVDGVRVFYREARPPDAPTMLLLHGFPSASHQFRRLIDALGGRYRLIAPDYPGFGHRDAPAAAFSTAPEARGSTTPSPARLTTCAVTCARSSPSGRAYDDSHECRVSHRGDRQTGRSGRRSPARRRLSGTDMHARPSQTTGGGVGTKRRGARVGRPG